MVINVGYSVVFSNYENSHFTDAKMYVFHADFMPETYVWSSQRTKAVQKHHGTS